MLRGFIPASNFNGFLFPEELHCAASLFVPTASAFVVTGLMTHNSVRAAALWRLYSSTVYIPTVIEDVLKHKNRVATVRIHYFERHSNTKTTN